MYFGISLVSSFFLVYFLQPKIVLSLFVILGQAHFLIAYIYANKYGKINKEYKSKFLKILFILIPVCFFIFFKKDLFLFNLLVVIALMFFVFHYFNDEFKISGLNNIEIRKFGTYSVMFSFFALLLVSIFKINAESIFIYFLLFVSIVYGFIFSINFLNKTENKVNKWLFYLFFLLNLFLPIYVIFIKTVSIYLVAGFIILFHYFRWYLRYLDIFKGEDLKEYFRFVFWCNMIFILLFIWHILSLKTGILYILFNPAFFYGWTLIHIIMSTRKEDLLV